MCFLSIIPVRLEPSGKATMVNQLLFGDEVSIIDEIPNWYKIQSIHDKYEGWCETNQLSLLNKQRLPSLEANNIVTNQSNFSEQLISSITATFKSEAGELTLVYGSTVRLHGQSLVTGDYNYKLDKGTISIPLIPSGENIIKSATLLSGTPYQWGGRSPFGIDCSGLIQIVFKMVGVKMPRDAWQQAEYEGEFIDLLAEAKAGDVAFFDNDEGKIIHTGILTGNDTIIHANGKVRLDIIDHHGIYNKEIKNYSHKLRFIRRFI